MKLKSFLFRLAAILTAFMLGVGFFNVAQYVQAFFTTETEASLPAAKRETLFVPPRPVPTVIFAAPEMVADSEENTEAEFDAEGYYYIIDDLPKGFEDFHWIGITTSDVETASAENNYDGTPIAPEGQLWAGKEFNFTRISISEKNMAFETNAVKGVSYKFSGKFLEKGPFWNLKTRTPVLEGRLVKLRKGKKVAEKNLRLGWYAGC